MRLRYLGFIAVAALGLAAPAAAQTPEEFFRGKTISVVVYGDPGSSYDIYARALARHMPDFIPGKPAMIVRNIPGAGGLTATRFLYNTAPRDGTTFGTVTRGIPFDPLFGATALQFDPLKFEWIGSMSKETTMYVSWHTSQVKTARDLFTKDLLQIGRAHV